MKICMISTYWSPQVSGIVKYPYRLAKHLAEEGYKIRVLTARFRRDLPAQQTIDGTEVRRLGGLCRIPGGFLMPFYPFRIMQEIRETDLVLVNLPGYEGIFALLLAKMFKKKTVSIYNCDYGIGGAAGKMFDGLLNIFAFVQLSLSDRIVTHTRDFAQSKRSISRFNDKLLYIMPPVEPVGVDEEKLNELLAKKADRTWIGFSGRISREKGIEHLIEAVRLTKLKDPVIIFAGPFHAADGYLRKLVSMMEKNEIPHIFLGKLNGGDLGAFYRSIDCLVLPSTGKTEAFGIVQAEAMLFGKPVIATDLPGVRVPVQITGMGKIAKAGNPRDLADKLEQVLGGGNIVNDEKKEYAAKIFDLNLFVREW
ncbi:MAG TPA: glycosyltransferase family 4 protein, partial [Candidatus Omnitrophota bacterium]|nr:glycosyltransferase family 4 protein [Candidatus Omnitrophota bacterium]